MKYPISEPSEQVHRSRGGLRVRPRSTGNFVQHCNVVYGESHGVGLVMDVFQPVKASNGRAIIDVVSGAWHSDRIRLNEHIGLGAIDAFCDAGFTVFAVAPGSASLFTALQMAEHVHAAIRHIRDNQAPWHIESQSLGLCGVSAGGHLAALVGLQPQAPDPASRLSWFRQGTDVAAVGLFFPPTDLLDFGGRLFDFGRQGDLAIPRLLFADGLAPHTQDDVMEAARAISPLHQIVGGHPPCLIAHATEDAVVPYRQSTRYIEALNAAGVDATLLTHEGPGHPWRTVAEACNAMATWFTRQLTENSL